MPVIGSVGVPRAKEIICIVDDIFSQIVPERCIFCNMDNLNAPYVTIAFIAIPGVIKIFRFPFSEQHKIALGRFFRIDGLRPCPEKRINFYDVIPRIIIHFNLCTIEHRI